MRRISDDSADLDSTDRDATAAVPTTAECLRVEPVEPGGAAAAATLCLPGSDGAAESSL